MSQDFSGQNLRGRNFKGQDLTGANFSRADIRGANFSRAILTGANFSRADIRGAQFRKAIVIGTNFSHARAGLQRRSVITNTIFSFIFALESGMFSFFMIGLIRSASSFSDAEAQEFELFFNSILIPILAIFFLMTLRKGLGSGLRTAFVAAIALGTAVSLISIQVGISTSIGIGFAIVFLAVIAIIISCFAIFTAAMCALLGTAINWVVSGIITVLGGAIGAPLTYILGAIYLANEKVNYSSVAGSAIVGAIVAGIGIHEAWRMQRDASIMPRGTRFDKANLTDADFTRAHLKFTDFTGANLTRTCFSRTEGLELLRVKKSYLNNPQIRKLLATGKGKGQNLDRLDLRGVNLAEGEFVNCIPVTAKILESPPVKTKRKRLALSGFKKLLPPLLALCKSFVVLFVLFLAALAPVANRVTALAYVIKGQDLEQEKKVDEAIASYRRAIQLNPKLTYAYSELGDALEDQDKWDEAIAVYREGVRVNPKEAELYDELGRTLYHQNKLDDAIAAYQKAIQLNPNFAKAHDHLGNALYIQRKFDEAIAAYRQAIQLNPDPTWAAFYFDNLGNALYAQGKSEEAIAAYRQAIQLDPNYSSAYFYLGCALGDRGKLDESIAAFRQVIRLDPKDEMLRLTLIWAICYKSGGNRRRQLQFGIKRSKLVLTIKQQPLTSIWHSCLQSKRK